jgi:D-alanine-D-alanine ligase
VSLHGITVGVVFGSRSVEHEISIITACQVMPVLQELGADVVPLYVTKSGQWLTKSTFQELSTFRAGLPEEGEPVLLDLARGRFLAGGSNLLSRPRALAIDVLFPVLHGTFGEDGTLAGLAGQARVPQVGSDTLSGALAMDKLRSKELFRALGLPVLPGRSATSAGQAREAAAEFGYPVVVKPNRGGSSIGVGLASDQPELDRAVEVALEFDHQVIVEPAVPGAADLNCAVKRLAPRASEVERPHKGVGLLSYADKYSHQGKLGDGGMAAKSDSPKAGYGDSRRELPALIPPTLRSELQRLAVLAFDGLGCAGTARVDFLLSASDELFLNEVNTIPGSLSFHLWGASGVTFAALLEELVRGALASPAPRTVSLGGNLLAAHQLLGKQ